LVAVPLADLYAAGLLLPSVRGTADEVEIESLDGDSWRKLFWAINALTSDQDPYRTVVDPHADTDIVEAALADDLADIYRDVWPATTWDDPEHLDDLLFELRFSFQGHWGRHALEAMRAIHWRRGYW
jgi:hypothetical protein